MVVNLWVMTLLGVEGPFHGGRLKPAASFGRTSRYSGEKKGGDARRHREETGDVK